MIFSTQFCFTIGSVVYLTSSLRDLTIFSLGYTKEILENDYSKNHLNNDNLVDNYGLDIRNIWTYGFVIILILTVLAWVRNLATFRFTFIFANTLLLLSISIVIYYSAARLSERGLGPNIKLINYNEMFTMLGFSIYTFEGIGVLMPCMQACDSPEKFEHILVASVVTVTIGFSVYGSISYLAYGEMKEQMVTQLLPQDSIIVQIITFLNVITLMLTYPLTVFPANSTVESLTVDKWFPVSDWKRKWAKNFSRFIICFLAAYIGIELSEYLDKVVGLVGAVLCAPLGLLMPTICHLKILAQSRSEKIQDLFVIAVSMIITIFCVI